MPTPSPKRRIPPIFFILIGLILFVSAPRLISFAQLEWRTPPGISSSSIDSRMSFGERFLFVSTASANQQKGSRAFAKGDYDTAASYFRSALQQQPNDPETAIYSNNASVGGRPVLQVAVSVPIGTNPNVAQEILRGVAQAQDGINHKGGIRGLGLQVQIANDDNDPQTAKQIATAFVNNPKILAVIGHNASNASLAAAPLYQQEGLVMVSPTSFANSLSDFGGYIFRSVPNSRSMATPLAEYIIQQRGLRKIAVCYDSQAPDNVSFRDEFTAALSKIGGQLAPIVCDFAVPNFNPSGAMSSILNSQAQGILLAPHIDRINRAIALTEENQAQLPLFGSPTLYTMQTLQEDRDHVRGLTLTVPWFPTEPFASAAKRRWGGTVNWRTANAYDAAQAITVGLQQEATRTGLQKALRSASFVAAGASRNVQFLPTGDRAGNGILVRVISDGNGGDSFTLLKR